ncbi:similar to Saccharomyces cerevisiae YCR048W ARE1 Acyl-CoA:sterol acyltransferase, isozyme of Are2p [Maudiozyma saulgeensis]|uniref:O-acyltransferase n=1 Tax=Maudiozyma saulgeensis TaxID=1789683 RepID=A0A1X7R7D8_9SACH|nr:similar to Saccharomyces cerevisiae YCR048W ARE1 Acyl-CoA:sterol acyltransferase, isozyme of Are2p [Kazachstania saulgeensis]
MTESYLKDKDFIKIQRLNSPRNAEKRKSLTQTDIDIDKLTSQLANHSPSNIRSSSSSRAQSNSGSNVNTKRQSLNDKEEEDKDAVLLNDKVNEKLLEDHAQLVKSRYKVRYRNDRVISYFDDVDFEYRPSILDGSINEPFRMSFEGPTLEKVIKIQEKAKRSQLRREKFPQVASKEDLDKNSSNSSSSDNLIELETEMNEKGYMHEQLVSNFSGLYVALWMAIGLGVLRVLVDNYIDDDGSLMNGEIMKFLRKDLFKVGFVDLCMYLCMYVPFFIHWLAKNNILRWNSIGWKIVSVYEFCFLIGFIYLPEHVLNFHWIAKIFLFLHSLVILMKMHSFAFYNGYLWSIKEELDYSTNALAKLEKEPPIEKDDHKSNEVKEIFQKSYDFCTFELNSQTHDESQKFPKNINTWNFFEFTMFPIIVYQIEYPRTERIRWLYVLEKVCAIFGTIFIMILNAQLFMYPIAERALMIRDSEWTGIIDRLSHWARLLIDIIPSFIVMYLLVFYLIWDAILNCIAELSRFGDRYFYGDWWNCVTWDEFSRIWNIPVHKFLLRHVYHSSISAFNFNKAQATLFTFFLSSVIHELSMYVIFKRLRLYIFFFQMLQLPLVAIGNTPQMKKKTILGNVIFWIGICAGPSVLCTLYLTI